MAEQKRSVPPVYTLTVLAGIKWVENSVQSLWGVSWTGSFCYYTLVAWKGGPLTAERGLNLIIYCFTEYRKYPVGAVTLLVLNIHNLDPAGLKLTGSLQQKQVEEYLLTTENSDLTSK